MSGSEFFLELLLEEMPAGVIPAAVADLHRRFADGLVAADLSFDSLTILATPRRLIALARGLPERQADRIVEVSGPPVERALGPDGSPTPMAEGFARAQGIGVGDLVRKSTPRGDVLVARRTVTGRSASEILAEVVPVVLRAMSFAKMMRWGSGEYLFVRPVHRIVAVFAGDVVPMSVFGVSSGRTTRGHRLFSNGDIDVASFDDYLARLREGGVEPDGQERAARLLDLARSLAAEAGGSIENDADLIAVLADLVEYPGMITGKFDPVYLELPEEILVTTLRFHQKYLPIRAGASLLPGFLAVMDNREDRLGAIAQGAQWVVNARLSDARFFFDTDTREPLTAKLSRLEHLAFEDRLGNYLQKTGRLQELSEMIGALVTRPEQVAPALEAARLAKIDLVTEMVREFPDLQGIVGGIYARCQGAPEDVWKAIYDQYRPLSADGELPRTETGAILSLADRFDTLTGFFGIGLLPTGSRDPYGLRRAAQGVIAIVLSRGWRIDWTTVVRKAAALHGSALYRPADEIVRLLAEFFADRVRYLFERRGVAGDVIAAVLAGGSWDFADLSDRAQALAEFRRRDDFRLLSLSARRIRNILKGPPAAPPDQSLFRDPVEQALGSDYLQLSASCASLLAARRYPELLATMTSLAPSLEKFFEKVLVNAPEPDIRANRHALLGALDREFRRFADFSEIVVEK